MTDFEREIGNAIILWRKNNSLTSKSVLVKTFQVTKNVSENPEVEEALKDGQVAFKKRVMHRILNEYHDTIQINRCDQCNCVVKTPKARGLFMVWS